MHVRLFVCMSAYFISIHATAVSMYTHKTYRISTSACATPHLPIYIQQFLARFTAIAAAKEPYFWKQTSPVYTNCPCQSARFLETKKPYFCRALLQQRTDRANKSWKTYRVAKTHRIPYLYRLFSAKEPYI